MWKNNDLKNLIAKMATISGHKRCIYHIHEASSVRKSKSSNIIPQRRNFVKSVKKQYGNPDSHVFFFFFVLMIRLLFINTDPPLYEWCWSELLGVWCSNTLLSGAVSDAALICALWNLTSSSTFSRCFFDMRPNFTAATIKKKNKKNY